MAIRHAASRDETWIPFLILTWKALRSLSLLGHSTAAQAAHESEQTPSSNYPASCQTVPRWSIANITRADYFYAGTAADLKTVYQGLSSRLVVEKKETEITALFALAGALLTVLAAVLSVWWFGRVA